MLIVVDRRWLLWMFLQLHCLDTGKSMICDDWKKAYPCDRKPYKNEIFCVFLDWTTWWVWWICSICYQERAKEKWSREQRIGACASLYDSTSFRLRKLLRSNSDSWMRIRSTSKGDYYSEKSIYDWPMKGFCLRKKRYVSFGDAICLLCKRDIFCLSAKSDMFTLRWTRYECRVGSPVVKWNPPKVNEITAWWNPSETDEILFRRAIVCRAGVYFRCWFAPDTICA